MVETTDIFHSNIFRGKTAFITGGGSGICLGMATALARHGASVAIAGRTQSKLDNARALIMANVPNAKVAVFALDVRNPQLLESAMKETNERFGSIDFVVCGAAGNFLCPAEKLSLNAFKTVIDIDLVGTFNTCKAALPYLKVSKGLIINVTATLQYKGTPMMVHACAAKAGVDALTRVLALEWGQYGIRVNGIAPGPIDDTQGMSNLMPELMRENFKRAIPLERFGHVKDIEFTTVYLCSEAAKLVTGTIEVVDGGEWLAGPMSVMSVIEDEKAIEADLKKKKDTFQKSKAAKL
ncbi:peroxisomal 2,4-dienoyl-CoA reductase [Chytriomyces cf. hyalinus JEL632]|nr:peroxisomal 2,4-dienoyl-CoA reductase [Chytriomyces cf. hyalinus JEL632]